MSSLREAVASVPVSAPALSRVVSIDIFRGLTIAVMIFVNDLAEVHGLPWWTYHAHGNQNAMTYVDMVFPFFLFIVGMSMPLSIDHRLKRDASAARLWLHVLLRSFSLLVLGLILANAEKADDVRMGISGSAWALLGLVGAMLYLNVYPRSGRGAKYAAVLRIVGWIAVALAFAIFRGRSESGHTGWIDFSYPEILGLIAFAYLSAALLYIPFRRWTWAAPAGFALMMLLNMACAARMLSFPGRMPIYAWPFGNGSHTALVMGGIVTARIFFDSRGEGKKRDAKQATLIAAGFAVFGLVAGYLLVPLGISKIRATPTWTLWNVGAAVLAFTLLYWICDQGRKTRWATLVHPAGANTLLTYLLPDIFYFLLGALNTTWLARHLNYGWQGVIRSIVFTLLMLWIASLLTRARVRLQL
jgi:heparan-alpha-glucosaminide N-acetyltransferase